MGGIVALVSFQTIDSIPFVLAAVVASSDLNTLVAWAQIGATAIGLIGVFVAIVTLILTLRAQTKLARFAATSQNIWQFDTEWHSSEYRQIRLAAATALRDGQWADEFVDIWNFFEMLGLMTHKEAIDKQVVENKFASKVINYWYLSQPLILKRRVDDQDLSLWEEFDWLRNTLQKLHLRVRRQAEFRAKHERVGAFLAPFVGLRVHPQPPAPGDLQKFINYESKIRVPDTGFWSWLRK